MKRCSIPSVILAFLACCATVQTEATAYTLTVTSDHGTVAVSPDKTDYAAGEVVELIPRPEVGYCFSHWSGDLTSKRLVGRVTMDSGKTVTANFKAWQPPIGIPEPEFGIFETYRMYDDSANRNPELLYQESPSGGYYTHYIDNTDAAATNTDNPYGTASKPRTTLPNPLPPGSIVEIHGGPYTYVNGGDKLNIQADGTSGWPVFIRGSTDKPHFERNISLIGKYLVFEGFYLGNAGIRVRVPTGYPYTEPIEHIAIRDCDIAGNGLSTGSGGIATGAGITNHIVIYANHIHHYGDYAYDGENDRHGVNPGLNSYHVWVLDNHIHHNGGDGFQAGHGAAYSETHLYVGRNAIHDNGEETIDLKEVTDVVVSENALFSQHILNDSSGGTLTVTHYGPTLGTKRAWFLYNEMFDADGSANGVTSGAEDIYFIGNVIHEIENCALGGWSHGNVYFLGNTVHNVGYGIDDSGYETAAATIANNLFGTITAEDRYHIRLTYSAYLNNSVVSHNLIEGQAKVNTGVESYTEGFPYFVAPDAPDFQLLPCSPAIDAGTSSGVVAEVFDRFEELYGIDIRKDIEGRYRPQGAAWDIGAYEYTLEGVSDLTASDRSQNSMTLTWTVPGGEGDSDWPGRYDIRYATGTITEANWEAATQVPGEPIPGEVGAEETFVLTGLEPGTTYYVAIKTSNDRGTTVSELSNVVSSTTTTSGNHAPVFSTIGDQAIAENEGFSLTVSATDADGDSLTYSATGLPTGASFTAATRTFAWTPSNAQSGTYYVTFRVSDGQVTVSQTITMTVEEIVNHAPVLATIGDQSINEGSLLSLTVAAADEDNDTLTFSATGLPTGANFTEQQFSWVPTYSQAGSYSVTFTASDGELTDSEVVTIVVANVVPDTAAPTANDIYPSADAIQIPLNALISISVSDSGQGVDANTVIIRVDDQVVYTGNSSSYDSAYGTCCRTGTPASYSYAYQADQGFGFDEEITVRVSASDLAGNAMAAFSYTFTTEMRSFGVNKVASWRPLDVDKGHPATVCDSSGNIWVAYEAGAVGQRDIHVSRLVAGADNFAGPVQLTTSSGDQCAPALALGSDDRLYVVWQDNRRGNWDIYGRTSTDGVSWSIETRITESDDNQIIPAIAVDAQSPETVWVAWQDDRAGHQDIYVASSADGLLTNNASRVTSNVGAQTAPDIAVDAYGTVYLVWTDNRNGSNDIYGADSDTGPWTNVPVRTGSGSQHSACVRTEASGTILHFAWVDDVSGNSDVYCAGSNGMPSATLAGTRIVDDTSGTDQTVPSLVVSGAETNAEVFVCWQDDRNAGTGSIDTDLYFADVETGNETNILVGDGGTSSGQGEPALGINADGHPYAVWTDGRNVDMEIYYAGTTSTDSDLLDSQLVTASSGGTVGDTSPDTLEDVSAVIPAGACPQDVVVSIRDIENPQFSWSSGMVAYEFGPSGLQFSTPVTITIPYAVADFPDGAPTPYWYDSQTGSLIQQGITDIQSVVISSTIHAVRFKTTHFTPYGLFDTVTDVITDGGTTSSSGGGGGGGCALSPTGRESFADYALPYAVIAAVVAMLRRRDRRVRQEAGR